MRFCKNMRKNSSPPAHNKRPTVQLACSDVRAHGPITLFRRVWLARETYGWTIYSRPFPWRQTVCRTTMATASSLFYVPINNGISSIWCRIFSNSCLQSIKSLRVLPIWFSKFVISVTFIPPPIFFCLEISLCIAFPDWEIVFFRKIHQLRVFDERSLWRWRTLNTLWERLERTRQRYIVYMHSTMYNADYF